ncbi:Placenta-specific gene 8 protein [Larimichthys crocea]|uniref:Uncharacterized protein n=1 Tax=Larimichthys crocea TaxID=215358 RepID=A0ACD3QNU1_LARCR|nr:Placenta-specific gene 8 protein [Larimichthys crocea]
MAVTNQPGRFQPSDFQTGLCDFCDDCGTCFYGLCCYACLGCTVARDMDECCLCGLSVAIRSVYRTRYNINDSVDLRWSDMCHKHRCRNMDGMSVTHHFTATDVATAED